jgi:hypothetical protein
MSLDRTRPNETRKPDFRELPDGRKRLTRYFDLPNGTNITDALVDAYGTLDVGPASGTTAGFANLRLVDQQLTKLGEASVYIKVYEELPATAEVQVGGATTGNSTIKLPDGRTAIEAEFIQLAGGTYTPGTVGTTTAPGDANAYLQREEMTTDGSVRRIKRQYVYAGQIQQVDETRNNGALLLRTIVSVKTTPSTPSGYTLISQRADPNAGLPIYTYTFAKGTGEIARDIDYAQSSDQGTTGITRTTIRYLVVPAATVQPTALNGLVEIARSVQDVDGHRIWTTVWAKGSGEVSRDTRYTQSTDQGTTGATVISIRHLTATSVTSNPISAPAGTALISVDYADQDGYRVWNGVYAKGAGTVSSSTDTRDGGKLVIYRKSALGSAPSAPSATIAGTVTLISDTSRNDSGYVVYERTWAEGVGEVSRDTRYTQSTDQGTTGATVISIRHLTATSVTSNPISAPAGTALISVDYADQDGYRVWNGVYAKGAGTVSSSTDTRDGGKLVIYRKSALGSAPSAPSATIAGTVTLISDTSRNDSGYVVYERTWAEGVGEVSRDTRYTQSTDQGTTGATVISIRHLTATSVTSNPISAPAGTALISVDYADQDGYRVWNGVYAKGAGTVSSSTDTRDGGKLVIYRKSALGSAPSAPSATIAGTVTLISDTSRNDSGYVVYERTWAEGVGEVSRDTRYSQSSNQGTTGVTVINVRHLTAGSVTSNPISTPAGTTLISVDYADQDGYRVWTATYAKGTGVVSKRVQFREGGLRIETWESLGTSYDAGTMKPTGILAVRDQDELDGFTRWTVSCWQLRDGSDITFSTGKVTAINVTFEGNSYTSAPTVSISAPPPGGTQATATAVLGTGLSSNIVASVTVTNQGAGYTSAPTVTFSGGGGSEAAAVAVIDGAPSAALTYTTKHAFTYPGRVKPFTRGQQMYDGSTYLATFTHDVFRSPPIQTLIEATVSVSYQRTAAIGGIGALLYNPDSWATIQANWVGQNYVPKNVTEALPGYRIVTDEVHSILVTNGGSGYTSAPTVTLSGGGGTGATAVASVIISGVVKAINITNPGKNYTSAPSVSFSGGGGASAAATAYIGSSLSVTTPITSYGFSASCMGERVVNNNTLSISLSGGPLKPDGQTYALEAQAEPAFVGYDGTQYFRTTVISATIPNQESLPL